ncbi:MAG: nuclear transport factor 2 family protein [Pseudomonadota bacterium]
MNVIELGTTLVQMCSEGKANEFMAQHYANDIVSIEGQSMGGMSARLEGIDAVRGKTEWWEANHDVHAMSADGPYVGNREDQFVVRFQIDVTPKGGERATMTEVALYTVADDKIVQEEFLYLMA